jgi:apolipoprotein N-acyltransferase
MRWRRPAAAFAAGLLLTAALPPFGWWPLAIAGVAVLVRLLEDEEAGDEGRRLVIGYVAALGFLVPGLWWMHEFTAPGYVLACLFEAVLLTIGIALGRGWALPAGLVVAESLRASWPFGGVPVPTIAQTQAGGPLAPVARVGGELLLTACVLVLGVALAHAWRRRWSVAAVLVGAVVVLTTFAYAAPRGHRVGRLDVAAVQGGGPRGTRAIDTDDALVYQRHVRASADVPAGVDLVLWPEDVVDVDEPILTTPEGDELSALAARLHATLVAGIVEGGQAEHQDTVFINFSQAWGPDGTALGRYEKNRRVPFGEFIPFRSIVEKLGDVSAVPRDARIGHGHGTIDTPSGRMGVVISWEVFFSDRARVAISHGGQVLLGPTNAASFSNAQMPSLELAAARLRAIETGRFAVQAAPTGFSAVVTPTGHVRMHSDLGARAVLHTTVDRRAGQTIYTRLGDGPFFLTALLLVLGGIARRWGARSRPEREEETG